MASIFLCALVLGCGSSTDNAIGQSRPAAGSVEQVAWMSGYWTWADEGARSEEIWLPPRNGVMVGLHVDSYPSRSTFFEYLRIEARGDSLIFLANPRGRSATEFVATEITSEKVVFSNSMHDYPQHIGYTITADGLQAEIWGEVDGQMRRSQWVWGRSDFPVE